MFYIFYSFASGQKTLKKAEDLISLQTSLAENLSLPKVQMELVIKNAQQVMIDAVIMNEDTIEVAFVSNDTSWGTVFYERAA